MDAKWSIEWRRDGPLDEDLRTIPGVREAVERWAATGEGVTLARPDGYVWLFVGQHRVEMVVDDECVYVDWVGPAVIE